MKKGPDGVGRGEGDVVSAVIREHLSRGGSVSDALMQLQQHPAFADRIRVTEKPDGTRSLAIAPLGGLAAVNAEEKLHMLAGHDLRLPYGSDEQKTRRRENLFKKLRDITPKDVIDLRNEYFGFFGAIPENQDVDPMVSNAGGSSLGSLERYFFDPDRVVAMCKALQDAVRQTAQNVDGNVVVLEAGNGLGYVALSALALNEELNNRVKVIGLEINPATGLRSCSILNYYGLDDGDFIRLVPADATKIKGLPGNIHILVAEHLTQGVFSEEPLYAVHKNLIPILKEPFFVIPEGLDVYGRVVASNRYADAYTVKDRVMNQLLTQKPTSWRVIEPDEIESMVGGSNEELMAVRRLARIKFADVLNGSWDGKLDLSLRGTALKNGKGIAEIRGVPRFHNDGETPMLYPARIYVKDDNPSDAKWGPYAEMAYGTSLNLWQAVREQRRIDQALQSTKTQLASVLDLAGTSRNIMDDTSSSPRMRFDKGGNYEVKISGPMDQIGANVSYQELPAKHGGSGKKR